MTTNEVLSKLHLETAIADAVKTKIEKNGVELRKIAGTAYQGDDFQFPLCKRMPLTRLTVLVLLLNAKYAEYQAIGASDEVIWDTFRDVSLRAKLYYERVGKPGLSKEDVIWFRHIMNINIFKIGALQYQKFEMIYLDEETIGEPYMAFSEAQKERLPAGTPVINCHVQRGADIRKPSVEKSLEQARRFFAEHFPAIRFRAFLCYSWLLYPPMLRMLPDESNIRQFAKQFSIISFCNDPTQAKENLFNSGVSRVKRQRTSLQKMAGDHKNTLGFGCGIIDI